MADLADAEPQSQLQPADQAALDAYTVFLDKRPPGPWISPHWTETVSGPVGVPYVVLDALARAVASATVDVKMRRQGVDAGDDDDNESYGQEVKRAQSAAGAQEQDEEWESVPPNHPARELFEYPNDQDSIGDILYQHVFQWGMTGSSYEWTPFNSFDEPCRIFSIPTVLTFALPISERYPNGAWRVMPQTSMGAYAAWPSSQSAMGAAIPAEQMVVDRNPHPWVVYDGYSKFQAAATQVDVLKQIDLMRSSAAQNGVEPSLVIIAPPGTSTEAGQQLQDKVNARYAGPYNFRKVLVLTGGATNGQGIQILPWSKSPGEVGGADTWEQMAGFVSALWGVPKVVSGLIEADSYAQLYAALKQFHTFTLIPLAKRIAQRWSQHILWPVWGRNLRVQLDVPAIDDKDSLRADLELLASNESLTVNELRTKLSMPKLPGPEGNAMVGQAKREHEQEMAATKQQNGENGNQMERDRPKNPDGKGSLGNRIATARSYSLMNGDVLRSGKEWPAETALVNGKTGEVLRATDASGHGHKGKGAGGGQFTAGSGGGNGDAKPSGGASKEKATESSSAKGPSRAEAVATERQAAREKYEAAKAAYEEARAAMEASGDSRREAFEEAKGEAESAKEQADGKVADAVDAAEEMYWFSGEKGFEAYDRLEEAKDNLRDAETFLERKQALQALKKVVAECQRIDVSKIKDSAGDSFEPEKQKENQVNLTKVANLIREVGEHMDAQRKHTEDARSIKVIRAATADGDGSILRAEPSLNGSH